MPRHKQLPPQPAVGTACVQDLMLLSREDRHLGVASHAPLGSQASPRGDALEKEMATHSSILAWRIPGMGTKRDNQGFRGQTQGEDWCWLHGDSLKGLECGIAATGLFTEESRAAIDAKLHC